MTTPATQTPSLREELGHLRSAAHRLNRMGERQLNDCLLRLADLTDRNVPSLLAANALDLARMDPADPKYDRLLLDEARLKAIAADLRRVAALPSPLGRQLEARELANGLQLSRVAVPIGVVGVVFESRPNVTFDVFALNLKAGNATVLKGSRDAADSNRAIKELIDRALADTGLPPACYLAAPEREALRPILTADGLVDVIIPRGSQGLIDFVRDNAKVPVIETGAGIVHVYFDKSGDAEKGKQIVNNAKTRRVSVCNALDCLIIHRDRLADLPEIMSLLPDSEVEVFADEASYETLADRYPTELLRRADASHFGTEFLSHKMSIKTVSKLDEALDHIAQYSSQHSEAIVAEDQATINTYMQSVNAAAVYANASTAFTDGAQFGMGAEIGISTQKLHARGPMALPELTSYKWLVYGDGQVRE